MVTVKEDLTGLTFGRLTVVKQVDDYVKPSGRKEALWLCNCECGNTTIVRGTSLKTNRTQSCGCLMIDSMSEVGKERHKTNVYHFLEDYGVGLTSNTNQEFYFDLEDYDLIKDYCWSEAIDKNKDYHWLHAWDPKTNKVIKMHNIIAGKNCDHIDRNPLNNRKINLRVATYSDNMKNRRRFKNNSSGIIGVYWNQSHSKWEARISKDSKVIYLGFFDNKDDAIKARLTNEKKYYGEFAPQQHLYKQYGII